MALDFRTCLLHVATLYKCGEREIWELLLSFLPPKTVRFQHAASDRAGSGTIMPAPRSSDGTCYEAAGPMLVSAALEEHVFISLRQLLRIGLLFAAIDAVLVLFPAAAHAGSGFHRATDSGAAGANRGAVLVNIDKTRQQMTVYVDGVERYEWPVSTGRAGYSTPSGSYTATSMNEIWYSKEWDNAPMPHSIFFIKDGHAIHGTFEVKNLGRPVSHGCVRISPKDAAILYALVEENGLENTRVVVTGVTPGGEYNVAENETSRRGAYKVARSQTSPHGVRRSVGVPNHDGSQGYYGYRGSQGGDYGSPWPWNYSPR